MAHPVHFDGCNKIYGAPEGRDDVGTLAVFVNGRCIVSGWELTDAELAEIVRTRRVFLSSMSGDVLFPCFIGSESTTRAAVCDYGKVW